MKTLRKTMEGMIRFLEHFRQKFSDVEGFNHPESEAVWDFFLVQQKNCGITGNFMEIGVYKGRSAYLASCHLAEGETAILVDVHDIEEVGNRIRDDGRKALVIRETSASLNLTMAKEYKGSVRWFHIDGDHSGYAVASDLRFATELICLRGVIVVDDFFNPRYAQITAEVYRFLFANPIYKMVFCGFNKCYLVRSEYYDLYESLIRRYLESHMQNLGEKVVLAKTSYIHDMGCWSLLPRTDETALVGRDQDPTHIPY